MKRSRLFSSITTAFALTGVLGALSQSATFAATKGGQTVAILPPGTTSPFHSQVAKGAQSEGAKFGINVLVQAPANETDFNAQVSMMENMVTKKVNAICVNPMDDKAISSAIQKANSAQIPVFFYNGLTTSAKGNVTEFIGYNQRRAGYSLGQYAIKLLHGHGDILILDGIPSYFTIERTGGFKDALKHAPGMHIVEEQPANWVRDMAVSVTTQALQAHPSIQLVFGDSDEMDIGASIAARELGKKIYTIGIDGNPVTLDMIAKGQVTATIGTYPEKMGETVLVQMHKLFEGQKIPKYLETSAVLVTKSNVNAYNKGQLWRAPKAGHAEIAH